MFYMRSVLTPNQKLRNWFSYHGKKDEAATKSLDSPSPPLITAQKARKPTAIAPWQAYSQLYFKKKTALYDTVHAEFKAFKSGDAVVLAKYSHLFPHSEFSSIGWLLFHQGIMRDHVKNASEEELAVISAHIAARLERELTLYERPWEAYSGGDHNSEAAKKKSYLTR